MTATIEIETQEAVEVVTEFRVVRDNIPALKDKIASLNKKAVKLGCDLITFEAFGPVEFEKIYEGEDAFLEPIYRTVAFQNVRVVGNAPRLNGWEFVATLEHNAAGNVVRTVPGIDADTTAFRTVAPVCFHCNTARARKDTYIVRHEDGRMVQVGANCLRDFLGHNSPQALAKYAELLHDLNEWAGGEGRRGGETLFGTVEFLSHVAACIRNDGWVSRTQARDFNKNATADNAINNINPPTPQARKDAYPVTADDTARAEAALNWVRNEMDNSNDYTWNLKVACAEDFIGYSKLGLVASAIAAYDRAQGKAIEAKKEAQGVQYTEGFLGRVGDKLEVEVTVTREIELNGQYGISYLYLMIANDGHWLNWFASNPVMDAGKTYTLKGTVKGHNTRDGHDTTQMTRCKVI